VHDRNIKQSLELMKRTRKMRNVITEEQLADMFDEALDEAGEIQIGTLSYTPSQVLKSTDPIAYRIGLSDYADYLSNDGYEVEGY